MLGFFVCVGFGVRGGWGVGWSCVGCVGWLGCCGWLLFVIGGWWGNVCVIWILVGSSWLCWLGYWIVGIVGCCLVVFGYLFIIWNLGRWVVWLMYSLMFVIIVGWWGNRWWNWLVVGFCRDSWDLFGVLGWLLLLYWC